MHPSLAPASQLCPPPPVTPTRTGPRRPLRSPMRSGIPTGPPKCRPAPLGVCGWDGASTARWVPACAGITEGAGNGLGCCTRRDTRGKRGYDGLILRGCVGVLRGRGGALLRRMWRVCWHRAAEPFGQRWWGWVSCVGAGIMWGIIERCSCGRRVCGKAAEWRGEFWLWRRLRCSCCSRAEVWVRKAGITRERASTASRVP